MAYVLPRLETKKEVDGAIKNTEDKVLLLRFGREADSVCMQLDEIVSGPLWAEPRHGTNIAYQVVSFEMKLWLCQSWQAILLIDYLR